MTNTLVPIRSSLLAFIVSSLFITGCETPPVTITTAPCTMDSQCQNASNPTGYCVNGFCAIPIVVTGVDGALPDLATLPADFATSRYMGDGAAPDLYGSCDNDSKWCVTKCIPKSLCCTNADCTAAGQTCQVDGTCQCPAGQYQCLNQCIPNAQCCTGADCGSKVCANGACAIPSCADGVTNGSETDIDCGGGFCPTCIVNRGCSIGVDCRSNACISSKCTETGFKPQIAYGGGSGVNWVAYGDFNIDGKQDIATANVNSNNVSILKGNGDGTFAPIGSYTVGIAPAMVAVGDLNLDGRMDIITPNQNSYDITVLLGNGDGSFQPGVSYITGGSPLWVSIGDMNGDKRPDLVVTNALAQTSTVLAGRGDGTFSVLANLATGPNPIGNVIGDFNKDKNLDVAVLNNANNSLTITLGTGGGMFGVPTMMPIPAGFNRSVIDSGDYNKDGTPDIVVGSVYQWFGSNATIDVLIGQGNGTFQDVGMLPAQSITPGYTNINSLDMNGDGNIDLQTNIGLYYGNGNGSFMPMIPLPGNIGPRNVAVADFNGDMKFDLAYPNGQNVTDIQGVGDGTYLPIGIDKMKNANGSNTDITTMTPRGAVVSDLNGDGRGDVVATSSSNNSIAIFMANANGTLQLPATYAAGTSPLGVAAGDLNGDGKNDLVVALSGESNVGVLLNNGNGTFMPAVKVPCGSAWSQLQIVDINNDAKLDLVGLTTGSGVVVVLGKGDGTFNAAKAAVAAGPNSIRFIVQEVTGDSNLDVVTANLGTNSFTIFPGNGDGTFGKLVLTSVVPLTVRVAGVVAADFNGDGIVDVAVSDNNSKNIYMNIGMGGNMFAKAVAFPANTQHIDLVGADFDKDGKIDVATVNNNDRSISVYLSKGDGTFKLPVNHDVGVGPVYLTTGDINADKKIDIVVANQSANTISVLLNAF